METLTRPVIDWHVESVPFEGESGTGDRGGVRIDEHRIFAFVIDALGHGADAAQMADLAERCLGAVELDIRLEAMIENCHREFIGTRGTAMCLAYLDARTHVLNWLSVGNIQAVRIQLDSHGMPQFESLVMRGGVVGDRLPELRASRISLKPGDMVVMATDGVGYGWYGEYRPNIGAGELARALRLRHCHGKDDALVLAFRYLGLNGGASP
ncbi:MAG TPA: SpoIIE family protein phosphatase [Gammaproteobacteria bacterium]